MSQLSPVSFHGDTIFCINHNDQPYTAMRPIVENMGLDWRSQQAKITSCNRWSVVNITTVAQDGKERQALCMPVRKLPAFLASINPKKVKPELRERIELYQAECDEVLWQYWTEGQATRPAAEPDRLSKRSDPERKALTAIIEVWVGFEPQKHSVARKQVNAHFGVTTVDELTVSQIRAAIDWVQGRIDTLKGLALTAATVPVSAIEEERKQMGDVFLEAQKRAAEDVARMTTSLNEEARKSKRRFFDEAESIARDLRLLLAELDTFGRGKQWKDMSWSGEQRALYDAMNDGVTMAIAGMEMARAGLATAARAQVYIDQPKAVSQ